MVDAMRMNVDGAADDGPHHPQVPMTFGTGDLDKALEGGVKSALSSKQGHAHYTATLSLGGWWN